MESVNNKIKKVLKYLENLDVSPFSSSDEYILSKEDFYYVRKTLLSCLISTKPQKFKERQKVDQMKYLKQQLQADLVALIKKFCA